MIFILMLLQFLDYTNHVIYNLLFSLGWFCWEHVFPSGKNRDEKRDEKRIYQQLCKRYNELCYVKVLGWTDVQCINLDYGSLWLRLLCVTVEL